MIALRRAAEADYLTLHHMQVTCFLPLLEKYHDDAISPAAEPPERMLARLREPITDYYFIFPLAFRLSHLPMRSGILAGSIPRICFRNHSSAKCSRAWKALQIVL